MSLRHPRSGVCIVAALAILLPITAPTVGQCAEPLPPATSLEKVPADAEAYGATLRLGETIETIGRSRAWKMIWNEPAVQEAWKKARKAYDEGDDDWGIFKKFLDQPENKDLPALGVDALSQEIFVYAGGGWGDLITLWQEVSGFGQYGRLLKESLANPGNAEQIQGRVMLEALNAKRERLRVPELVIGFKVSDPAKVTAQLKRLDVLLAMGLMGTPLKGRSERTKVGSDEFLTLKLDGSLVPWDDLPLEKYENKPNEFAALITKLKQLKTTVAIGVRQGYLLISVGQSLDHLAKFGGDGPKLASRPEFKPLAKFAGKPLTSISFTSANLRRAVATSPEDIAGLVDVLKAGLEKGELPVELRKAIEKDVAALAKEIAGGIKKPGAEMGFSFRTPRGWESLAYDFTEPSGPEPRPLTLLDHLGGDPLVAAVWRSGTTVDDYQNVVKWVSVFAKHAEEAALAKAPDAEEMLKKYRAEVLPLLKELNDIIEKLWLPALADGQEAIVLDAKWTSKRWHAALPESETPLPLLELGIVLGVSDSAKLQQALESYRVLANKLLTKARGEVPAGTIPDFEIPKPKVDRDGGNLLAHYPIPADLGVDPQFQPTGGLSKKVAALSLSRGYTQRLLNQFPLKIGSPLLADTTRPLASVFHLNWAGIVDAAAPWVSYVKSLGAIPDPEIEKTARKAIKFLKVFRSYTSVTYRESGATVTRSEGVFRDIEPDEK